MTRRAVVLAVIVLIGVGSAPIPAPASAISFHEYRLEADAGARLREAFLDQLSGRYPAGSWAPLRFEPTDDELALLGLPPRRILASRRYPEPTIVTPDGRSARAGEPKRRRTQGNPAVATFAGAGWFGIRPGALLLVIDQNTIGVCSLAHVYGSPGSYDISTAGHCGKTGQTATVVGAIGNRGGLAGPVLLDFGQFQTSHDGGLGNDWALIDIAPQFQSLVSPTMAAWGGPVGMFTKTGSVAAVTVPGNGLPSLQVTPDPFLAQAIVHYGHGLVVGTGGTARAGTAIHWGTGHFMFSGVISPGDSGSGTNTLAGDTVGAEREAAGIITHLWIDLLMRSGVGIMGGTRATQVSGTLANGQLVAYPVPAPGLP